MKTVFICIDFQKEFTRPEGKWFNPGESIGFVKNTLAPYLREKNIKVVEIISDYRQPRPGDSGDGCYPGTVGYESDLPEDLRKEEQWIKSKNSPIWVREGRGDGKAVPGIPYQDADGFGKWLEKYVGDPKDTQVILFGLTLDCCVFATAQELDWRAYKVFILREATDTSHADMDQKSFILSDISNLKNWAKVISFEELKELEL